MANIAQNNFISKSEMYDLLVEKSELKENIVFILGAGASFGYSNNKFTEYLPPIVANLFDEDNEAVKKVINLSKHNFILGQKNYLIETLGSFDNDLEKYLSFLYNKNDEDNTFSALLLYIQDLCWLASSYIDEDRNNYKDLINRMSTLRGKLPWSCISFNYDTILEKSFIAAGRDDTRRFDGNIDYLGKNPKVLKMHGSINYRFKFQEELSKQKYSEREIFNLMMREKNITGSSTDVIGINSSTPQFYSEMPIWDVTEKYTKDYHIYNYPLMMIPIHNTKKSEHPFFESMLEEARREIDASSLIIVIGYNFGDELLLEQLKKIELSKKTLILVGTKSLYSNPDGHIGFQNAINNWGNANIKVFKGDGFNEFVRAIIRRQQNSI